MSKDAASNITLIGKWGFDGSSGYSQYKQVFQDKNNSDDSNVFVTSYVPLRLLLNNETTENMQIWKNPCPSSTRYCRPLRIQFKKETKELSREEVNYYKTQVEALQPTITYNNNGQPFPIKHKLQLTMVDGKVCNALTETSSATCYVCNAKPREMNNIDLCLKKEVNKEAFQFGLSPLHAWIRFFEYFLHIAYRLNIKKWQVRQKEEKEELKIAKANIQKKFREKMGLIVDTPKQGGSGTSNDGNTARKFFFNAALSAEITGLNKNLIEKCAVILRTISSGYPINTLKFKDYVLDTATKLVREYPWYYLPASVHKILIHSSQIIEFALLPIGELSEEAAETRNKDIKYFRTHNTRKISRYMTNRDLLNRLLLTSDPFISGLRKFSRKKQYVLPESVLNLLV